MFINNNTECNNGKKKNHNEEFESAVERVTKMEIITLVTRTMRMIRMIRCSLRAFFPSFFGGGGSGCKLPNAAQAAPTGYFRGRSSTCGGGAP